MGLLPLWLWQEREKQNQHTWHYNAKGREVDAGGKTRTNGDKSETSTDRPSDEGLAIKPEKGRRGLGGKGREGREDD